MLLIPSHLLMLLDNLVVFPRIRSDVISKRTLYFQLQSGDWSGVMLLS